MRAPTCPDRLARRPRPPSRPWLGGGGAAPAMPAGAIVARPGTRRGGLAPLQGPGAEPAPFRGGAAGEPGGSGGPGSRTAPKPLSSASRCTTGSGVAMATRLPSRVEYWRSSWKLKRLWPKRDRGGRTSCTSSAALRRMRSMTAGTSSSAATWMGSVAGSVAIRVIPPHPDPPPPGGRGKERRAARASCPHRLEDAAHHAVHGIPVLRLDPERMVRQRHGADVLRRHQLVRGVHQAVHVPRPHEPRLWLMLEG